MPKKRKFNETPDQRDRRADHTENGFDIFAQQFHEALRDQDCKSGLASLGHMANQAAGFRIYAREGTSHASAEPRARTLETRLRDMNAQFASACLRKPSDATISTKVKNFFRRGKG